MPELEIRNTYRTLKLGIQQQVVSCVIIQHFVRVIYACLIVALFHYSVSIYIISLHGPCLEPNAGHSETRRWSCLQRSQASSSSTLKASHLLSMRGMSSSGSKRMDSVFGVASGYFTEHLWLKFSAGTTVPEMPRVSHLQMSVPWNAGAFWIGHLTCMECPISARRGFSRSSQLRMKTLYLGRHSIG